MKHKVAFSLLFLALAPTALASTTWYVDGVHGSDNNNCKSRQTACKTIGHAISLASSGDSIRVAAATYTENLTIGINLKILGARATTTIIDGGGVGTVVSIGGSRVALRQLTIRNGFAIRGGGIDNSGKLAIDHSSISGNAAEVTSFCGVYGGAGIYNGGTLTISDSTVSRNIISHRGVGAPCGGGIYNSSGRLTINNSTVSENSADDVGGGIFNKGGTLMISSSTIAANSAGSGGGIHGSATLRNSIVADNSGGNCSGTMTSKGYNLSSDNTCNFNNTGDLNNTDPKLGTLGNYGGPTQTNPLLSGSPAIDAGNPTGCTDGHGHLLKTDQRGKPRPDKEDETGCDMGAYERQRD